MKTEYEKIKTIRRCLLNKAGELLTYSWSNDFKNKELQELKDVLINHEDVGLIDPTQLTLEECEDLGFGKWDEGNPLRLIPVWLYEFVDRDIETTGDIDGNYKPFEHLDNDHRCGFLADGVIPKS